MEIVYRKIEELNKLDSNPRTITEEDMEVLKDSIRNNPDYLEARPLVLSDRTGTLVIIDGNQRYEACLQLGLKEVPTALLHGLTEEREREIIIRANVNNGKWDLTKLFEWDYRELMDWGVEGISFPEISDFNEEEVDDTENILRNQNYEAGAHIKYLVFEGYKIPVSEKELDGLKQRATEYMNENGVMVGFVNNLLGL
ncbi:ParB N-terminal domain-containing protein [uncultured Phocaeicola sp.]|uniref:ParB N-terminal domain-containing protein n=1 Tax=uncultured Phocaeicola sp. TaxID=990718 RepID=UPI002592C803|nr:ParB N-terminal domain-containing protein [uncultured Phocaeicola sp.]